MNYFEQRDIVVQARIDRVMTGLPDFCRRFALYCNIRLSKLTACSYLYVIRQFFSYLGKDDFSIGDLNEIKTRDVENFLQIYQQKIDMNGVIYKYSVIRTFLGYFYTRAEITRNVAEQILMPKIKDKTISRLSKDEVTRLLRAVENCKDRHKLRDKTIIVFLLQSGIRVSELVGLDLKDVDIENASFTVRRKGGKIETLYMTNDLLTQLCFYLDTIDTTNKTAPLFASEDNPRIADNTIRLLLDKYATLAGIKRRITPHGLRRTFGTQLYRNTRDIFVVAQFLGHTSVNTTRKHYAAIDEDIKRDAIRKLNFV
jgi:site-specific recombinase XerD